jgi:HEAT repeat protein
MAVDIKTLIEELSGELNDKAYEASDSLGHVGTEEVVTAMINLLEAPFQESRIMAARTLGMVKNNSLALDPMLQAIQSKENSGVAGDLLVALEGFDISDIYVEIFKMYLFGSFKVSNIAKDLLDHKEFNISPRVIKKATKHWSHYSNNVKQDDAYELQKMEVEERLAELTDYLSNQPE